MKWNISINKSILERLMERIKGISDETHTCDTEKEYLKILKEKLPDRSKIPAIIEHEKAHFEKAKEIGYQAIYLLRIRKKRNGIETYQPGVYPIGDLTPKGHRTICLAPEDPSSEDLRNARRYKRLTT
jgi:hypothetical protein